MSHPHDAQPAHYLPVPSTHHLNSILLDRCTAFCSAGPLFAALIDDRSTYVGMVGYSGRMKRATCDKEVSAAMLWFKRFIMEDGIDDIVRHLAWFYADHDEIELKHRSMHKWTLFTGFRNLN